MLIVCIHTRNHSDRGMLLGWKMESAGCLRVFVGRYWPVCSYELRILADLEEK